MKILSNREIAKNTFEMKLECSDDFKPGQFINIKIEGFYLRRPISVCDFNQKELTIIYKIVGEGTKVMSKLEKGISLDVLAPLGNGYDTSIITKEPILVGGGAGVPPMFGLAKALKAEGKNPTVILGFNSKDEVFYEKEFKDLGVELVICTLDGSYGAKGLVTDMFEESDYSCGCGPEPMLKAIADKSDKGQYSFEARMACGFGGCMGCSCETKYGSKRICKDGPVLNQEEIIW
ncbi:MAG: dihydroorotate dehydrogenase electron transfer subunit [Anaerovoracaceae bacterium]